ncbi:MAG: sigma-70 family RNA polymerase sigma factor [Nitrososphaerota archaeon]|jgi:DNA-binding CsgD family transcriptional regulator|nr:sigma-70 family RNA polymerase sigma factor [Nitrososphaerota archaeon]MDG6942263.1 sigma-70 family RNA polymerase sigma factor [Nitrososphaerota archaeon]MDG6942728.1 sigma-70 family RNA polymerase sigma factor [Nitrososphaerota archaeon]MDG6948515.1 sigma-70 family RNA polymerase sigma factor [Nitrososphaerota archaeon]MDG6950441.1 sigma-70 family RNA polymerase sigma factor [Nitrososphaerota archaeon]
MDENQFVVINAKLDSIMKLLALNAVQGKQLREQVGLLSSVGFQPKQIADMLGKTPNHISVILHDIRKKQQVGSGAPEPTAVPEGEVT